jgi:hypothetical protein
MGGCGCAERVGSKLRATGAARGPCTVDWHGWQDDHDRGLPLAQRLKAVAVQVGTPLDTLPDGGTLSPLRAQAR